MTPLLPLLLRILALATAVSLAGGPRTFLPLDTGSDQKVSPLDAAKSVVLRLPTVEVPRVEAPSPRNLPDVFRAPLLWASNRCHGRGLAPAAGYSPGRLVIRPLRRIPRMGSDEPPRHV